MPRKLICFTPEELRRAKEKRRKRAEERAMEKYKEGVRDGQDLERSNNDSILAAALFQQLAREPGQVEVEIEVHRSLAESVHTTVENGTTKGLTKIKLTMKKYLPD